MSAGYICGDRMISASELFADARQSESNVDQLSLAEIAERKVFAIHEVEQTPHKLLSGIHLNQFVHQRIIHEIPQQPWLSYQDQLSTLAQVF